MSESNATDRYLDRNSKQNFGYTLSDMVKSNAQNNSSDGIKTKSKYYINHYKDKLNIPRIDNLNDRSTRKLVGAGNAELHKRGEKMIDYHTGEEKESLKESEELLDEAASPKIKGVKLDTGDTINQLDIGLKIINQNWDKIKLEAATRMLKDLRQIADDDKFIAKNLEKYPDEKSLAKGLKLLYAAYGNEGMKYNPICGMFSFTFDTDPPMDRFHCFTLFVMINKDKSLYFESVYDG